jgi:lipopolysaccharide transport system ATP-binding protein
MSSEIAISIKNLSKCYQVYAEPHKRLLQILARGYKKYFREFWALREASFEIQKGETVGIVGQNGSGKSTLLQIICGTLNPTAGEVLVGGKIAALLELGSGFNPDFTGVENIYLNAGILGMTKEEIDNSYEDIIAFADIGEFVHQPTRTYSSGMLVRLAFAIAIHTQPEILIIDEALSVGDEFFQKKCFTKIEEIKKSGATILFVSHSAQIITQLCDRAILLHDGEVILDDLPRKVIKEYQRIYHSKNIDKNLIDIIKLNQELPLPSGDHEQHVDESCFYNNDLFITNKKNVIKYPINGGEILSFDIFDSNSSSVNSVPIKTYCVVKMRIRFDASFKNVFFGFHLKSVQGLEVAGLSYPNIESSGIDVEAGSIYELAWPIRILISPGMYFCTFGVRSLTIEGFIHRVVDGLPLNVLSKNCTTVIGLFDISSGHDSQLTRLDA